MKVLIADNSKMIRERLKSFLQDIEEIEFVDESKNSYEAVLNTNKYQPDVVILDIIMPGGGFNALREIKKGDFDPIVIIFTSYVSAQFRERSYELGADYFFDKSLEFEKIPIVLRQLKQSQ